MTGLAAYAGAAGPLFRAPSVRARVGLVVLVTCAAYHHSLATLAADVGSDTPLAYLGLIPALVLGVALVKGRPRPGEGRLPHRHADWIVSLPLLAVAVFVAAVLPGRLSYVYWTNRIDMLGLPFFVAGLVALVLGGRVLHRVRLPVALLALAWPLPYQLVLDRVLAVASRITLAAVGAAAPALGVGREVGGTLFAVGEGAGSFTVNVAPQCAGASSALGFLVAGGAVVAVLGGRRRGKLAWLAAGVAAQLALNVGRILLVFAAGDRYGESVAIDWLHPYVGLVLFAASFASLVALLPRFGVPLRLPPVAPEPPAEPATHRVRRGVAVAVAVACALGLGARNGELRRFDPFLGVGSAAPYRSLAAAPAALAGWSGRHTGTVGWARPYFGPSSTWERLTYAATGRPGTVFVDVVNTADLRSFSRYGLEACYRFHDYDVVGSSTADVGAPARAQTLAYRSRAAGSWAIVSWVWPVGDPGRARFERVAVMAAFDGSTSGAEQARTNLLAFSRALVRTQRARSA